MATLTKAGHAPAMTAHAGVLSRLQRAFGDAFAGFSRRAKRRATLRQLAALDDGMLIDIGIRREEIGRIRAGDDFTPGAMRDRMAARGLI